MPVTIISRMHLWSLQAFIFLTAGELQITFISQGLSEQKAGEGKQTPVLVINMMPKPFKKVSALARTFISLF